MLNVSTVQAELPVRCTLLCDQRAFVRFTHKSVRLAHVLRYAFRIEVILKDGFPIKLALVESITYFTSFKN
jgi:hypothetical protein